MPDFEALTAALSSPIWTAAAAALALAVIVVAARVIGANGMVRLTGSVIALAAVIAGGWFMADRLTRFERASERRALDQRSVSLTAQAVAPGSALACLDAMAGEAIEAACEQAVFAGPSSVAAAISYTAARLSILADADQYAKRADHDYEAVLAPIRAALESDRFGIVAHVLSLRDSCTELQCDAFALLRDPGRVQGNLKERTFESFVSRHSADWTGKATLPSADSGQASHVTSATPVSPRYDFPSAASIPPVSIMNPEPGPAPPAAPVRPAAAAPPPAAVPMSTATPTPPRRPPAPPRAAAPRQGHNAPVQIAPPVPSGETDGQSLR